MFKINDTVTFNEKVKEGHNENELDICPHEPIETSQMYIGIGHPYIVVDIIVVDIKEGLIDSDGSIKTAYLVRDKIGLVWAAKLEWLSPYKEKDNE